MNEKKEFGFIHGRLFHIYQDELRKFLPMALIFILISFCYALTRSLKEMFIMAETDAEAIFWIKAVAITPSMIFFTILYGKVSRSTSRDGRFNATMLYFLCFFIFAYLFLFPKKEVLQLPHLAETLVEKYPRFKGLWQAICYWPSSLFYIHSEAWGTFALNIVFWTFVNEITSANQTKRFYTFLSMFASIGSILGGLVLKLESVKGQFNQGLLFVILSIVLLLVVYNYFTASMKANPAYYQVSIVSEKKELQVTFMQSIKILLRSKYLLLIATLVISYGLIIALFESVQKDLIKQYANQMHEKSTLAELYSQQQIAVGTISILVAFGFATPILKKSWRFAASTTPITALIMVILFFTFLQFGTAINKFLQNFNTSALHLSIMLVMYNIILIKSVKYVLFDPNKEAAYVPLDNTSKVYGKAAIDGVGSRIGKNLASILVTSMTALFGSGTMYQIRNYTFCIIIIVIVIWLMAIKRLSKLKAQLLP